MRRRTERFALAAGFLVALAIASGPHTAFAGQAPRKLAEVSKEPPKDAAKSDPPTGASPANSGENPTNLKEGETPVFTTSTRLVVLHATVQDRAGKLLTDLPKSAFTVTEEGVPQKITLFRREDVPVSMGLIVDNSGSMRPRRQQVESAALDLVRDSNKDDEVFVVNFNDEAYLDTEFTGDIKQMEQGLTRIDARGGTAMRDAIRMSVDHLKEKGKRDKKILVIVTDGDDNSSSSTNSLENVVKAAQDNDVIVYAVGLLNEEEKTAAKRAKRALLELTEATGGVSYFPKDASEVDTIAHQVAHDIRNQYTLGYAPSNPALDGSFRKVSVVAIGPGKPVVRTRSGYYASPDRGGKVKPKS